MKPKLDAGVYASALLELNWHDKPAHVIWVPPAHVSKETQTYLMGCVKKLPRFFDLYLCRYGRIFIAF